VIFRVEGSYRAGGRVWTPRGWVRDTRVVAQLLPYRFGFAHLSLAVPEHSARIIAAHMGFDGVMEAHSGIGIVLVLRKTE